MRIIFVAAFLITTAHSFSLRAAALRDVPLRQVPRFERDHGQVAALGERDQVVHQLLDQVGGWRHV